MSLAGLSCPGCGSSNIVDDDLYCQAQLVCVDCGSVVSEGVLAHDPVGGSDVSYNRTAAVAKKPCSNLIKGLQRVRAICQILRVNKEIEELAQTYYNKAYQHDCFIKVTLHKKEVLGGCCILLSCRLLNWPLSMASISSLLEADPAQLGTVYLEMVKVLNIDAPVTNVTAVMESHCAEFKLSASHVPEELAESCQVLSRRAVALVELAGDSWIVTGRRPIPIMTAAMYLAWQSLKPSRLRLKYTLEKFCRVAQVTPHRVAKKRVVEMKEVLCKLGKEIPWQMAAPTAGDILLLVDDILKHRHALLRRAVRAHEDALLLLSERQDSLAEERPATSVPGPESVAEETQSGPTEGHCSELELGGCSGEATKSLETEQNWGKKLLFAPPCVVRPKRRRVQRSEGKDVTGDEEISDSEIDSYIRTPREARDFAVAQKMLEGKSEAALGKH